MMGVHVTGEAKQSARGFRPADVSFPPAETHLTVVVPRALTGVGGGEQGVVIGGARRPGHVVVEFVLEDVAMYTV